VREDNGFPLRPTGLDGIRAGRWAEPPVGALALLDVAGVAPGVPRALAGRYRLVRPLAKGGMAEVWEGRDEVLSRPVAVKMLLAHLAADPHLRERFRREAVTAARLVHPGIVATFDAGVTPLGEAGAGTGSLLAGGWTDESESLELSWPAPSTAFIVMELVPGETLRDLMARACPLPPDLAVALVAQVTDALAYAHAQGLVHRDIKPANVLLRDEGGGMVRVKVADFGIAKAAAAAGGDLTASGTVLGTPKYLAPEQVQGHEPDARADLYSLGVVLFEMLAGAPPFKGTTDMATALAHVQQPPPRVDDVRPGLPPGLGNLVDALLVKEPDKRVPSALVLGGALTAISRSLGMPAQSEPGAYLHIGSGTARATSARSQAVEPSSWSSAGLAAGAGRPTRVQEGSSPELSSGERPSAGTIALEDEGAGAPSRSNGSRKSRRRRRKEGFRRRPGVITSAVVATLLVAGVAAAVGLWRAETPPAQSSQRTSNSATTTGHPDSSSPIKVLSVSELTQNGNHPTDNVSQLGSLIDGNSATAWEGDVYQSANFGGSGGFGLALDLGSRHTVHELVVSTSMQGWSAEAFTSDSNAPLLSGWGTPTASRSPINGSATFSLGGRKASWVLLWMTDPGPTRQAQIQELTVR
jgi:serine/threonine protein kinase